MSLILFLGPFPSRISGGWGAFPGICIPNPADKEMVGMVFPSPLSPAVCAFPPLVRNQDIAEAQLI